jgi:type I restriction enzyme, R subunit
VQHGWTEADTRAERIDCQLGKVGWHVDGIDFEAEYEVGSFGEPDHGFSDYMLPGADGLPLAIVEAKRSSRDAIAGKEQARNYAMAIEARTGRRPMIFLANGDETWYWDLVENPRRVGGFFRRQDLERRFFQAKHSVPLSTVPINATIVERPYQHEAIRRAHEAIYEHRRRMLWVMATGTGKTRAVAALVETLIKAGTAQQVLFLGSV